LSTIRPHYGLIPLQGDFVGLGGACEGVPFQLFLVASDQVALQSELSLELSFLLREGVLLATERFPFLRGLVEEGFVIFALPGRTGREGGKGEEQRSHACR